MPIGPGLLARRSPSSLPRDSLLLTRFMVHQSAARGRERAGGSHRSPVEKGGKRRRLLCCVFARAGSGGLAFGSSHSGCVPSPSPSLPLTPHSTPSRLRRLLRPPPVPLVHGDKLCRGVPCRGAESFSPAQIFVVYSARGYKARRRYCSRLRNV